MPCWEEETWPRKRHGETHQSQLLHGLLFQKTRVQLLAPIWRFTAICTYSSRGSDALFWPPEHCTLWIHRHTSRHHTQIPKIKINFERKIKEKGKSHISQSSFRRLWRAWRASSTLKLAAWKAQGPRHVCNHSSVEAETGGCPVLASLGRKGFIWQIHPNHNSPLGEVRAGTNKPLTI